MDRLRLELRLREPRWGFQYPNSTDFGDMWERHADLKARDRALLSARYDAREREYAREAAEAKRAERAERRKYRTQAPSKCPTCGFHTIIAKAEAA